MQDKTAHPLDIHIGQQLRLRRKMMGMSQMALGKRVAITFQQIQKYERGTNSISARRLYQFADVLQVSPMYFYETTKHGYEAVPDDFSEQAIRLIRNFNAISSIRLKHIIALLMCEMRKEISIVSEMQQALRQDKGGPSPSD